MKSKGRYITTSIRLACLSQPPAVKKDIHAQLEETMYERRKILDQYQSLFLEGYADAGKDIHVRLKETIAKLKQEKHGFGKLLSSGQNPNSIKTAA